MTGPADVEEQRTEQQIRDIAREEAAIAAQAALLVIGLGVPFADALLQVRDSMDQRVDDLHQSGVADPVAGRRSDRRDGGVDVGVDPVQVRLDLDAEVLEHDASPSLVADTGSVGDGPRPGAPTTPGAGHPTGGES